MNYNLSYEVDLDPITFNVIYLLTWMNMLWFTWEELLSKPLNFNLKVIYDMKLIRNIFPVPTYEYFQTYSKEDIKLFNTHLWTCCVCGNRVFKKLYVFIFFVIVFPCIGIQGSKRIMQLPINVYTLYYDTQNYPFWRFHLLVETFWNSTIWTKIQ